MNSLLNNDAFLPEGNRCNFEKLKIYGPCTMSYDEPAPNELQKIQKDALLIKEMLLDDINVYKYCGSLFNYRIGKAESFVKNLYILFNTILLHDVQFTYSPQFGINLWPGHLGYFRNKEIEEKVQTNVSLLFTDFITETTTFLRYHIKFRYNHMFHHGFKKIYILKVIKALLYFASTVNKVCVMQHSIENALNLILINKMTTT